MVAEASLGTMAASQAVVVEVTTVPELGSIAVGSTVEVALEVTASAVLVELNAGDVDEEAVSTTGLVTEESGFAVSLASDTATVESEDVDVDEEMTSATDDTVGSVVVVTAADVVSATVVEVAV